MNRNPEKHFAEVEQAAFTSAYVKYHHAVHCYLEDDEYDRRITALHVIIAIPS